MGSGFQSSDSSTLELVGNADSETSLNLLDQQTGVRAWSEVGIYPSEFSEPSGICCTHTFEDHPCGVKRELWAGVAGETWVSLTSAVSFGRLSSLSRALRLDLGL